MRPVKYAEKGLTLFAGGLFNAIQSVNKYKPNPSFTPKWSDKPLLKSWQKTKPTLGWPRTTDSLCPQCVIEAREEIISGKRDVSDLLNEKVGEIKAQIIERDGQIWMVKDCPVHGHFEDIMAIDSKFLTHIEKMFPGRDIPAHNDETLHNHGSSTIKYGRGAVLTVDLTNRCNMMCDPCFMDANPHRQVGNLFDVKLRAINNLHEAGVEIVLVTTLVNGINNDQVGSIIRFALDNPKKIAFLSFQPVSFTGRDEAITPERRLQQRYTLSHLAHDVKKQVGITEPTRDWFPLSLMGAFADFADLVHGPEAEWGQVSCGCHPNCGVGTAVMLDKETKEMSPVPEFLNIPGLVRDMQKITDAGRGKWPTNIMMGLALLKHYNSYSAPTHFSLYELFKKFDKSFGLTGKSYGRVDGKRTKQDIDARRADRWNFLFIAGMWFQDLFNYDFRRTEMCIIPYGTQEGEISFCAYNTGIGWRNIIEQMHQNATVAKWYEEHGRHEIFAKGKAVNLDYEAPVSLALNETDLQRPHKPQMQGPKTAAEEAQMMRRLYQEMVLKQKLGASEVEKNKPVQIKGLSRAQKDET